MRWLMDLQKSWDFIMEDLKQLKIIYTGLHLWRLVLVGIGDLKRSLTYLLGKRKVIIEDNSKVLYGRRRTDGKMRVKVPWKIFRSEEDDVCLRGVDGKNVFRKVNFKKEIMPIKKD